MFGFVLLFLGFTVYLPFGNKYPLLKTDQSQLANLTSALNSGNITRDISNVVISSVGCPEEYSWCKTTPQIHLAQLLLGMFFLSVGYPIVLVLSTSIYSKIIGPNQQVR